MVKTAQGIAKKSEIPRYMQVAEELRDAILDGTYAEGASFPTETSLCDTYDVSRFTVREALKRLQSEGLIARRRGSGTVVQPSSARGGALHQPLSNVGEILQYARDSFVEYAEQDCGGLPEDIAVQVGGNTSGAWRCFRGVRRMESRRRPIAVTNAYFHESLGSAVDELDLTASTLFAQLQRNSGVHVGKVTQDIQALAADAETADALDVEEGDPVLRILRCYYDKSGKIFEISASFHPGERFAYSMHIDLDQ